MSTRAGTTLAEAQTGAAPRRRNRAKTRDELQRAMLRVKNKGLKLSISAVATEAGVSAGLVHNTYPDIAEEIRTQVGRGARQQRDAKAAEVKKVREQLKILRAERDAALADVARLASINETLRQEVETLQAVSSGKVVALPPRNEV
ncbi:TetR family transcriptional regulator (plasmid) [Burkholderia sp. JP2-270]|uniref:TetR family transcriptional regulator n=1 Tax=Burkholderia sp. JP2-270 TaxID=2217913 RepID=UPI000DA3E863|nr:TetR family transcriptional regulator [Burkholderia sp. JP2-270]AWV05615.1 TetR family transcriptional regulator [Burkholderia sp. JP2-270]